MVNACKMLATDVGAVKGKDKAEWTLYTAHTHTNISRQLQRVQSGNKYFIFTMRAGCLEGLHRLHGEGIYYKLRDYLRQQCQRLHTRRLQRCAKERKKIQCIVVSDNRKRGYLPCILRVSSIRSLWQIY